MESSSAASPDKGNKPAPRLITNTEELEYKNSPKALLRLSDSRSSISNNNENKSVQEKIKDKRRSIMMEAVEKTRPSRGSRLSYSAQQSPQSPSHSPHSPKTPNRSTRSPRDGAGPTSESPRYSRPTSRAPMPKNLIIDNVQAVSFGQLPRDSSTNRSSRGSCISPFLMGNSGGFINDDSDDSLKSSRSEKSTGSKRASVSAAAMSKIFNQSAAAVLQTSEAEYEGKKKDKKKASFFEKLFK
jgi:hypothetical protein